LPKHGELGPPFVVLKFKLVELLFGLVFVAVVLLEALLGMLTSQFMLLLFILQFCFIDNISGMLFSFVG
jgi:hypothetical protein